MPPFHQWYLNLINQINWLTIFLLTTLQKLIPLILIKNFIFIKIIYLEFFFILFLLINIINENNFKKIIGNSSIFYTIWIILIIQFNLIIFLIFFFIYSLFIIIFIIKLNKINIYYINDFFENKNINFLNNIFFFFMSIYPPTLIFLIKWTFIINLVINNLIYERILLIFISLFYLFIYLRIISLTFLKLFSKNFIKINFLIFLLFNIIPILLIKYYYFPNLFIIYIN